ncbi:hypothetical protein JOQ06_009558, partial [Pogonophryne albipinna]
MILQRSADIEHFTALHLDKWICRAARLPHLKGEGGRRWKRGEKVEKGRQEVPTHCFLSNQPPPPSPSKHSFTPLPVNLHYSVPSLLSPLPLSSSPSSVAGATLSGTADRYVNWAGALTRTACISPQVESRVSDEDSIGKETKWHMMVVVVEGRTVWEISSQPEQRKKEALR